MYDPVGEVDVGGAGFGGGVFFEEVADFEVEVWEVSGAAEPVVVGIDVGEGYYLAAFEGGESSGRSFSFTIIDNYPH